MDLRRAGCERRAGHDHDGGEQQGSHGNGAAVRYLVQDAESPDRQWRVSVLHEAVTAPGYPRLRSWRTPKPAAIESPLISSNNAIGLAVRGSRRRGAVVGAGAVVGGGAVTAGACPAVPTVVG